MPVKNAVHDPESGPHQDQISGRGDDNQQEERKNQPPHGHISHGVGRFLSQIDPDTLGDDWIEELGERYQRYQDDTEQAGLEDYADD